MVNVNAINVARLSRKLQKIGIIQAIACWHGPCQKGSERNGVIEKGSVGKMKKGLIAVFCLIVLTFSSLPVAAQTRYRRYDSTRRYEQRTRDSRYQDRVYNGRRWNRWDQDRSFWEEHRDKITTGIGAGAGAVLGGAMGGKKGAILGAIIGGGGAAVYTYGIRDKNHRRY